MCLNYTNEKMHFAIMDSYVDTYIYGLHKLFPLKSVYSIQRVLRLHTPQHIVFECISLSIATLFHNDV